MIKFVRHPYLTKSDDELCDRLCNETFGNKSDPQQMELGVWTLDTTKRFPYAWTVILDDDRFVGYTFILPATEQLMYDFVSKKINENQLNREIFKGVTNNNFSAIYLAGSVILPQYKNRGYALRSVIDTVEKMNSIRPVKKLFIWPFTKDAKRIVERSENILTRYGYELLIRE